MPKYQSIVKQANMNKLKFLIILLTILQACKKDMAPSSILTLDEMNTSHSEVLNAVFIDNLGGCSPAINNSTNSGFVFQNIESLQQFQHSIHLTATYCDTALITEINFDNYDLIGIQVVGICKLSAERQVVIDKSTKQYIYNIIIHTDQLPTCKMLVSTMNWAIVPKMPAGYSVQFNVVKVYS